MQLVDGVVATGRQVSLVAEPVVCTIVPCNSHNDFVWGGEAALTLFSRRDSLDFNQGWIGLKYSVIFAEFCETPGEGLILPEVL